MQCPSSKRTDKPKAADKVAFVATEEDAAVIPATESRDAFFLGVIAYDLTPTFSITGTHRLQPDLNFSDVDTDLHMVSPYHVGIDSYAGARLFGSTAARGMLKDFGSAEKCLLMGGIGGSIEANDSGTFPFGSIEVHISRKSPVNLLCWAKLEDEADDVHYHKSDSLVEVDMGGHTFMFKRNSRNVYTCDMEPHFKGN
jgi:hypothetical protein